jgi:hypothetical protein
LSRRNTRRTGAKPAKDTTPTQQVLDPLHFVAPTEFVDLPSKGMGYPEGHPLSDNGTIEIRFMTAKDEDILTSTTLLKKGIAIDRFLQNVIVDKNIKVTDLLIGDKNAVLIAARASGYGNFYETQVTCPACGTKNVLTFDLNQADISESMVDPELGITSTTDGTFMVSMPYTKFNVEVRLLTGEDEQHLARNMASKKKNNLEETAMTDQYKRMIISVNGHKDRSALMRYVENMPLMDARHLRLAYKLVAPNIEIKETLSCNSCDHQQEVDVPFGADFFWPDR